MSIASQLQALENNISDAYDMVSQRGGTVPARKNMENLDSAIATIPSGGGSQYLPFPGTRIVNGKVEWSGGINTYATPSYITDAGYQAFAYWGDKDIYYGNIYHFDFSSLTAVSGQYAFEEAFKYFEVEEDSNSNFDFSNVVTISGTQAFYRAWYDSDSWYGEYFTVDFSSLTTITGSQAFKEAFLSSGAIQTISFPSLTTFGNATNYFNNMLSGCSNVTVHFPAALQSVIGSWSDVQNGFGGTNTTVLFDL